MPHVRLFIAQFALSLVALIVLGVAESAAPGLPLPVLLHILALCCAGYVARPGRRAKDQKIALGVAALAALVWIVFGLGNSPPDQTLFGFGLACLAGSILAGGFAATELSREEADDATAAINIAHAPAVPGLGSRGFA